jgi:hypothetical protein
MTNLRRRTKSLGRANRRKRGSSKSYRDRSRNEIERSRAAQADRALPVRVQELEYECQSLRDSREVLQRKLKEEHGRVASLEAVVAEAKRERDEACGLLAERAQGVQKERDAKRMDRLRALRSDDFADLLDDEAPTS